MKNRFVSLAALLFASVGTASLSVAADTFNLDSVHSMVVFQINHFHASNPFGIFHAPTGSVTVTDGVPALDISVPVDKVDMGLEKWEKDIKAAGFFDVKQFPNITFKTTSVKKTGDNTFEATGDLTLHGVTKSITVTLTGGAEVPGMAKETRIGFDCTFKVKRSDYGMTTAVGMIGDEVTLMVNIEAAK
jgi:polyisoprenoid-binding protein YceI